MSERIPLDEMGKHWIHAGVFPEPGPWPTHEYRDQLAVVGCRMLARAERGARAWEPEGERSDTVCRDCGRRVDLSRTQCSRCFGTWLRLVTGEPVTVGSVAKRQAAREAQG